METENLQNIANSLRRDVLSMTTVAGSGHPTSCMSCAEIMSVLFFNEMAYDIKKPSNPDNDEFILSKGHAAPILYSSLKRAGCINENLNSLRKLNSDLEGHPVPNSLKWIKVGTGSLGQGLSVGLGFAFAAKLQERTFRTYVLLGDSEIAEGSIYEALQIAGHYKLNNLCAIIDVNRLGQRGETMLGHQVEAYRRRFESFGWNSRTIDGHNLNQIINAFDEARKSERPFVIIAKTIKGKGVSFLENMGGWHGKALDKIQLKKALAEIPNKKVQKIEIKKPEKSTPKEEIRKRFENNSYRIGKEIATREAYGNALASLTKSNSNILVLDGEVSNSTMSEKVKGKNPGQFVECYIAEQNMIGMTLGLSVKGFDVFASSFSAFLTRAHDQLRMSAVSKANFTVCGSHSGISIGKDGVSQMGLEDIGMFRSLPNSTIFYPSDAVSTEKLTKLSSELKGIKYIRTTRPKTKVIYDNKEKFSVGDFKILKQSDKDKVVLVGAGITAHECIKAYKELKNKKIPAAVVDLYCIKPFNQKNFIDFVRKHGNALVVSEDHYAEGGIGEMLSSKLNNSGIKIKTIVVREIPHSGEKDELLRRYGINWEAIVRVAKSFT